MVVGLRHSRLTVVKTMRQGSTDSGGIFFDIPDFLHRTMDGSCDVTPDAVAGSFIVNHHSDHRSGYVQVPSKARLGNVNVIQRSFNLFWGHGFGFAHYRLLF
jgi:hypothetical protein